MTPELVDSLRPSNAGWEEIKEEIFGGLHGGAFDILAFYKSVRFKNLEPFPGSWGIFYFDYGIKFLGDEFAAWRGKKTTFKRRYNIALELLRLHELYHFKVDAWSLVMEASARKPLYERYKLKKEYLKGFPNAYYEESLANGFALEHLRALEPKKFHEYFVQMFQPEEYQLDLTNPLFPERFPQFKNSGELALVIDILQCANEEENISEKPKKMWETSAAKSDIYLRQLDYSKPIDFFDQFPQSYVCPYPSFETVWGIEACPQHIVYGLNAHSVLINAFSFLPNRREFEKFIYNYLGASLIRNTDHEYVKLDNDVELKIPNPHGGNIKSWELKGALKKAGMTFASFKKARDETNKWNRNCPRRQILQSRI